MEKQVKFILNFFNAVFLFALIFYGIAKHISFIIGVIFIICLILVSAVLLMPVMVIFFCYILSCVPYFIFPHLQKQRK